MSGTMNITAGTYTFTIPAINSPTIPVSIKDSTNSVLASVIPLSNNNATITLPTANIYAVYNSSIVLASTLVTNPTSSLYPTGSSGANYNPYLGGTGGGFNVSSFNTSGVQTVDYQTSTIYGIGLFYVNNAGLSTTNYYNAGFGGAGSTGNGSYGLSKTTNYSGGPGVTTSTTTLLGNLLNWSPVSSYTYGRGGQGGAIYGDGATPTPNTGGGGGGAGQTINVTPSGASGVIIFGIK